MDLAEQIRSWGYTVEQHVLRVNNVLLLYLPSGKWLNQKTGKKGHTTREQLPELIRSQLAAAQRAEKPAVPAARAPRPHWQEEGNEL